MAHMQVKKSKFFSSSCLLKEIRKIKNREKSCICKQQKNIAYTKMCGKIDDKLLSNWYKTTSFGTTQKWSSWTGSRLIKHLYKTATNKIRLFMGGFFDFIPTKNAIYIENKDLLEHTYIKKWC